MRLAKREEEATYLWFKAQGDEKTGGGQGIESRVLDGELGIGVVGRGRGGEGEGADRRRVGQQGGLEPVIALRLEGRGGRKRHVGGGVGALVGDFAPLAAFARPFTVALAEAGQGWSEAGHGGRGGLAYLLLAALAFGAGRAIVANGVGACRRRLLRARTHGCHASQQAVGERGSGGEGGREAGSGPRRPRGLLPRTQGQPGATLCRREREGWRWGRGIEGGRGKRRPAAR